MQKRQKPKKVTKYFYAGRLLKSSQSWIVPELHLNWKSTQPSGVGWGACWSSDNNLDHTAAAAVIIYLV